MDNQASGSPLIRDLDPAEFAARYGCDRFVATVLANRYTYILEHLCERLLACAFSPILRDFYDFAATLSGPPELNYCTPVVSKTFVAFTGTMTDSVRNTIMEYGPERLEPGDVIIGNDPYRTGTHVNDVLFSRPVFFEGKLSGFVNLKAHQLDMGGSVPGGFSSTKTNVYENGLVMSPRALIKAGRPVRETWTLIGDNVRFGDLLSRDMKTICACLELGEQLLLASLERYGRDAVLGTMKYICDADAECISEALKRIPDGTYHGESMVDCDGIDDTEEYPVRVTIRKAGGRIEIDLSGTGRQARTCINGTYLDTKTTVGVALKFLLDPDGPFTSGLYRCVDVVIPDGAICSALPPDGAVFAYGESTNAMIGAIFQALENAVGEAAIGGDISSPNLHTGQGRYPDGRLWIAVGVGGGEHGAWGGTRHGDADSYNCFLQANSIDTAIEASEADYPLATLRREYLPDRAGAGYNRGGTGVVKDTLWFNDATHSLITLRYKKATGFGVRGGKDGEIGGVWLWQNETGAKPHQIGLDPDAYKAAEPVAGRIDPETKLATIKGDYVYFGRSPTWPTKPMSTFRYITNAGGGWGDPLEREIERVKRDVRDGYITIEGAREDYGVIISGDPEWDPENLVIDVQATENLRAKMRTKHS